jgi:hypothetical protein
MPSVYNTATTRGWRATGRKYLGCPYAVFADSESVEFTVRQIEQVPVRNHVQAAMSFT